MRAYPSLTDAQKAMLLKEYDMLPRGPAGKVLPLYLGMLCRKWRVSLTTICKLDSKRKGHERVAV